MANKTNPPAWAVHQKFDQEEADEYEAYAPELYDLADDELIDQIDMELYDPVSGVNTMEDSLESDREEPFFDVLHRETQREAENDNRPGLEKS